MPWPAEDLALDTWSIPALRPLRGPATGSWVTGGPLQRELQAWRAAVGPRPGGGAPCALLLAEAQTAGAGAVCVRVEGQPAGIWPLRRRRLGPATVLERVAGVLQPYDGLMVHPLADPAAVAGAALEALMRARPADALHLSALPSASPLAALPALQAVARPEGEASVIDLEGHADLEGWMARRSRNRRRALRRRRELLLERGEVRLRLHAAPAERLAALGLGLRWKARWLEQRALLGRGLTGADTPGRLRSALADPALSPALPIFSLEVGGETVAVEIAQLDGRTCLSWLGAYDPAWARLGVGAQLTVEVIGWCLRQGLSAYDLLPPRTDFKADLVDHHPQVVSATLPLRPAGRLLAPLLRDGRRLAKEGFHRLPAPARAALRRALKRAAGDDQESEGSPAEKAREAMPIS
jgi:CelD/BcsL family acetyltransferase involved in cellulose biosynthesis